MRGRPPVLALSRETFWVDWSCYFCQHSCASYSHLDNWSIASRGAEKSKEPPLAQTTNMRITDGFCCCCFVLLITRKMWADQEAVPGSLKVGLGRRRAACAGAGAQSSWRAGAFPSLPPLCACRLCSSCPSGQDLEWLKNLGPPRSCPRPGPGAWMGLLSEAQSSSCFEWIDHRKPFRLLSFLTVLILAL